MSLSAFIAAAPRQSVATVLPLADEMLEVRPLTLAEVLRLWDAFNVEEDPGTGTLLQRWAAYVHAVASIPEDVSPPEKLKRLRSFDLGWMAPVYLRGFLTLWPEKGIAWAKSVMAKASAEELAMLHQWYVERHSWTRILSELFQIDFGDGRSPRPVGERRMTGLEFLLRTEKGGGRRIEEMLAMTPEAYLDYIDQLAEINRRDEIDYRVARSGGRRLDDPSELGGSVPGFPTTHGPRGSNPMPSTLKEWPEPKWPT